MSLTEDQKQNLQKDWDKCDAALIDKPMLAAIYDSMWRQKFREKLLNVDSMNDIAYPIAYSAPLFETLGLFPLCYQYRLEEGAVILLSKLSKEEKNHLIKRLRDGCPSAEEELLLARGFAQKFGRNAIAGPSSRPSSKRPEFVVNINGHTIGIEATGLFDSIHVRLLWEGVRLVGQNYWELYDDTQNQDLKRVEGKIKEKIKQVAAAGSGIIVFTQYTVWPVADQTIDLIRRIVVESQACCLLAVAYVSDRLIQGVWFNSSAMNSSNIGEDLCERLRQAIKNSFYPRDDGLFFDEGFGCSQR